MDRKEITQMSSILDKATTPARRIAIILAIASTFIFVASWVVLSLIQLVEGREMALIGFLIFPIGVHKAFFDWLRWGSSWDEWYIPLLFFCFWISVLGWPFALGKISPKWERFVAWIKTGK